MRRIHAYPCRRKTSRARWISWRRWRICAWSSGGWRSGCACASALRIRFLSDSFAGGEANPSVIKADTTSIGSAFLGTALGAGRIQSGIEPSTRGDVPRRGEAGCSAALGARTFGRPAGATRPSTKTRSSALSQRSRSRQSQRIRAIARGPSALEPSAPPARPRGSDQGLRPPPS